MEVSLFCISQFYPPLFYKLLNRLIMLQPRTGKLLPPNDLTYSCFAQGFPDKNRSVLDPIHQVFMFSKIRIARQDYALMQQPLNG